MTAAQAHARSDVTPDTRAAVTPDTRAAEPADTPTDDTPTAAKAYARTAVTADTRAAEPVAVLSRYDELAAMLAVTDGRPPADPALSAAAAPLLLHEARLLDAGRFEEWLAAWTDDAVLWVPLSAPAHPGTDQSLLLDDRRRLAERVEWHRDPSAWGQHPPSRTTRIVGAVEAWPAPGGIAARSTLVIDEHRHGRHQQLVGHQIHELVGDDLRRRTKILVLPALGTGVRNPSFLL